MEPNGLRRSYLACSTSAKPSDYGGSQAVGFERHGQIKGTIQYQQELDQINRTIVR